MTEKKEIDVSHLTNESATVLVEIIKDMKLSCELDDVLMQLCHADLTKYRSTENFTERFGYRYKKSDILHIVSLVINGMANRIDELEKQLNDRKEKSGT